MFNHRLWGANMVLPRIVAFPEGHIQDSLERINELNRLRRGYDHMREMAMMNVQADQAAYLKTLLLKIDEELTVLMTESQQGNPNTPAEPADALLVGATG
jgi:hypothetical protein